MASPCVDPVSDVINTMLSALRDAFDPAGPCPSDAKETPTVRFFVADVAPTEAWNAHTNSVGCSEPFLWVRAVRRYRSQQFPAPTVNVNPCSLHRVIVLEVGVARCAVVDPEPSWDEYAIEAEASLDDSFRLEKALCRSLNSLKQDHQVGSDAIVPFGPEGGVIGWTTQAYISF